MLQPDQPTEQQPAQEPSRPPIRWKDIRFNGHLLCRVNVDDPTHLQVLSNNHGKRRVFEVSTKAMAVTGQ